MSCWGGSCRVRPRANTVWVGKRRKPHGTHLEGHLSTFKIYFCILCKLFNALMESVIQVEDTCGGNECSLAPPVTKSQWSEGWRRRYGCSASSGGSFVGLWVLGIRSHALNIFHDFFLWRNSCCYLSFSFPCWDPKIPFHSSFLLMCVHVYVHVEVRGQLVCCSSAGTTHFDFSDRVSYWPRVLWIRPGMVCQQLPGTCCLCLPDLGIVCMYHHAWWPGLFVWLLRIKLGFSCLCGKYFANCAIL